MPGKHKFISVTLGEVAQILGVPTGDVYHAYQCGELYGVPFPAPYRTKPKPLWKLQEVEAVEVAVSLAIKRQLLSDAEASAEAGIQKARDALREAEEELNQ